MAETSHGPESYTNPEVRFERVDLEYATVMWYVIALGVSTALVAAACLWYGAVLMNQPRQASPLPPAKADEERRAPSIALEALEDIRDRDDGKSRGPMLYPPRAKEYYAPQDKELATGAKGGRPVADVIATIKLPTREKATPAPDSFRADMPNKSSAGTKTTRGEDVNPEDKR